MVLDGPRLFDTLGPADRKLPQRQVEQFDRGVLGGKGAAIFGHFAQRHVQRFHRIGRIDDLADLFGKVEERNDPLPAARV